MMQNELTGEQKEARRRRNFWLMMAAFTGAGFITGMLSGIFDAESSLQAKPAWAIAFVGIALAAFVGLSVVFFRRVDELELADNLWGGLFGLYFYMAAQPTWYVLNRVDLVGPIEHWPLYFATCLVTFAVYLGRKFLNR